MTSFSSNSFPPPFSPEPQVSPSGRVPDPGSRLARNIALIVLVVFYGLTVFLQQTSQSAGPAIPVDPTMVEPPGVDPAFWMAKFSVKFVHMDPAAGSGGAGGGGGGSSAQGAALMPRIDEDAKTPVEKIRAAMIAGDLLGRAEAMERLKTVAKENGLEERVVTGMVPGAAEGGPAVEQKESEAAEATEGILADSKALSPLLIQDLGTLGAIYRGEAVTLTPEQRQGLEERHGWYGRLALVEGLPDSDPAKEAVVGGGGALLAFCFALGAGFVLVFLTGIGLLIFCGVRIMSKTVKWRFVPPAVGGSVYLETAAVFVLSFVLFKVVLGGVLASATNASGPMRALGISVQWLLVLPVLWPLVRGVRFGEMRRAIGWHSGEGVLKEMGAGILAYLAGIPILLASALAAVVILFVWEMIKQGMGGTPSPPPQNPIIDLVGGKDPWTLISFFVLATMWAPIVEEAIFRGCVFRHSRSRVGAVLAGVVSAVVFGGMHGYAGPLLLPVTTLGFVFAMMREWRGSLIAPMTAHFLHNATVTAVLLTFVMLLGD